MNYFPVIQEMIWLGEDLRAYQHVVKQKLPPKMQEGDICKPQSSSGISATCAFKEWLKPRKLNGYLNMQCNELWTGLIHWYSHGSPSAGNPEFMLIVFSNQSQLLLAHLLTSERPKAKTLLQVGKMTKILKQLVEEETPLNSSL